MKLPSMKVVLSLWLLLTSAAFAQTSKPAQKPASATALSGVATPGQKIYEQYCLSCHQASGSGVPNLNPPLKQTSWVLGEKPRLINVLLKGLQDVDIDDDSYDNAMPAHDFLTDDQIADVLTYVRTHFGNKASAVTTDEVKAVRAAK